MPFSSCNILKEHVQLEYCWQGFQQESRNVTSFYSLSSFVDVWLTPNGFLWCFPRSRWVIVFTWVSLSVVQLNLKRTIICFIWYSNSTLSLETWDDSLHFDCLIFFLLFSCFLLLEIKKSFLQGITRSVLGSKYILEKWSTVIKFFAYWLTEHKHVTSSSNLIAWLQHICSINLLAKWKRNICERAM